MWASLTRFTLTRKFKPDTDLFGYTNNDFKDYKTAWIHLEYTRVPWFPFALQNLWSS